MAASTSTSSWPSACPFLAPRSVNAGATDDVNGSAGSTDNGADSFVPRGGRRTDMRAGTWTCGAVCDVDESDSCCGGGTDMRTKGCTYENPQEGSASVYQLQTTSPPPSLCPHANTCSHGRLAYAFYALAHRCRCGFLIAQYRGLLHPSRASSAVRISPPFEVLIAVMPNRGLIPPLPLYCPTPHQGYATLRSSISSAPRAHTHTPLPHRRHRTLRARCRSRRSSRAANGLMGIQRRLVCVSSAQSHRVVVCLPRAGCLELAPQSAHLTGEEHPVLLLISRCHVQKSLGPWCVARAGAGAGARRRLVEHGN